MKSICKSVVTLLCIFCFQYIVLSQDIVPHWAFQVGGLESDRAIKVIANLNGDIYFTGIIEREVNYVGNTFVDTISCEGEDILFGKINPYGQLLWSKHIWSRGDDSPTDLAVNATGDVFLSGNFQDTLFISTDTLISSDYIDSFIAKFDSLGNLNWVIQFAGTGSQQCTSIFIDLDGNLITGGFFSKTLSFPGTLISNLQSDLKYCGFFAKWNAQGEILWVKQVQSKGISKVEDVLMDNFNDYYIAGNFTDTLLFNNDQDTLISQGENDVFLLRYFNDGLEDWAINIGSAHNDNVKGLTLGGNGKITIIGDFKEELFYQDESLLIGAGGYDIFHLTFNKNRNLIKAKKHGLEKNDFVFDAWIPIGSKVIMASDLKTQPGDQNVLLATYELLGEMDDIIQTGADYNPLILSAIMPIENEIIFCGSFRGDISFDQINLTSQGDDDFFIIKMAPVLPEQNSLPMDSSSNQSFIVYDVNLHFDGEIASRYDSLSNLINDEVFYNYPNPFIEKTQIIYSMPRPSYVCLKVLNMNGICIKEWEYATQSAGIHSVEFINREFECGVYYCQLVAKSNEVFISKVIKMVLMH